MTILSAFDLQLIRGQSAVTAPSILFRCDKCGAEECAVIATPDSSVIPGTILRVVCHKCGRAQEEVWPDPLDPDEEPARDPDEAQAATAPNP